MKRFTTLAIFIALVTITFAQTHMYVWKNGAKTNYVISEVDSITFGEEKGVGVFSVGENKKVAFSTGNLQHNPKRNEWRFADNQTDYIGDANANISETYNGWIDLFGWSGHQGSVNFGVSSSIQDSDYDGLFVDWGANKISNDESYTWRTLRYDEWWYLLFSRMEAESLQGIAQVNGVNGLIILPDNWTCPIGVVFIAGFIKVEDGEVNTNIEQYSQHQTFNSEEWSYLEQSGAVFLPAAGDRYSSYVNRLQESGKYWAPKEDNASGYKGYLDISTIGAGLGGHTNNYYYGYSVRLVKDIVTE